MFWGIFQLKIPLDYPSFWVLTGTSMVWWNCQTKIIQSSFYTSFTPFIINHQSHGLREFSDENFIKSFLLPSSLSCQLKVHVMMKFSIGNFIKFSFSDVQPENVCFERIILLQTSKSSLYKHENQCFDCWKYHRVNYLIIIQEINVMRKSRWKLQIISLIISMKIQVLKEDPVENFIQFFHWPLICKFVFLGRIQLEILTSSLPLSLFRCMCDI